MEQTQAKEIIRKMLAIWPQVGRYWADNSSDKVETHNRWIAALEKREAEHVEAVLADWECIACNKDFLCRPVQTICELADAYARRNKPRQRLDPPNREVRETNLAEMYERGRAAIEAGEPLEPILELVK